MAEKLRTYIVNPFNGLGQTAFISEKDITAFCTGCDVFEGDGIQCRATRDYQARYAARDWCGKGSVNHIAGEKTKDKFRPWGNTSESNGHD